MTNRCRLTDIEYHFEQITTVWEPPTFRGKNILSVAEDGSKLCEVRRTQVILTFESVDTSESGCNEIDIYPELRKLFRKTNVTQGLIQILRDNLIGRNFLIEDGKIVDLDYIINDCRMAS